MSTLEELEQRYFTLSHEISMQVNGNHPHMVDVDHDIELGTLLDTLCSEFDTKVLHDFIVALDNQIGDSVESLELLKRLGKSLANEYPQHKDRLMACLRRYEEIIQEADGASAEPPTLLVKVLKSREIKEERTSEPKQPTIKEEDGVITPAF